LSSPSPPPPLPTLLPYTTLFRSSTSYAPRPSVGPWISSKSRSACGNSTDVLGHVYASRTTIPPPSCDRPCHCEVRTCCWRAAWSDRKSTRLNSSHDQTSYAVFCL